VRGVESPTGFERLCTLDFRGALSGARKPLTIPDHRTLKPSLLRHLMRDAEVDSEEFRRLLSQ
jgi:hypothetical protein